MIAVKDIIPFIRNILNEVSTAGDDFSQMVDASLLNFIRTSSSMLAILVPTAYQKGEMLNFTPEGNKDCYFTRPDGMTAIKMQVPDDFCRFISLHVQGWIMPVNALLADTNVQFRNQYTSVPGIGAGPYSPLAFLSNELDKEGILKSYIIAHAVSKPLPFTFSYVKRPEVTDTQIDMDVRLQDALAYYTASLYLQSINDVNGSKAAYDVAGAIIQNLNNIAIV